MHMTLAVALLRACQCMLYTVFLLNIRHKINLSFAQFLEVCIHTISFLYGINVCFYPLQLRTAIWLVDRTIWTMTGSMPGSGCWRLSTSLIKVSMYSWNVAQASRRTDFLVLQPFSHVHGSHVTVITNCYMRSMHGLHVYYWLHVYCISSKSCRGEI